VLEAWTSAKVLHDPAASVRYASVHGDGLVELRRYKESLTPLNEAIKLANANPYLAYPSIAVNSKIDGTLSAIPTFSFFLPEECGQLLS
jgi:hypothetical protein